MIELLVSMGIFALVITAAINVVTSSLALYRADQGRLGVNRNARSTFDLMGNDIRQAGERLGNDFPAITLTQDSNTNAVLTLRRGLADSPLPVCSPVGAGGTVLYVNAYNPYLQRFQDGSTNMPASCPTDPQDLTSFNAQLAAGVNTAYIYDVKANTGSWAKVTNIVSFPYNGSTIQALQLSNLKDGSYDPRRVNVSDVTGRDVRIYLLEERKYTLAGSTLVMGLNGQDPNVATPNVQSYTVTPYLEGNPPVAATLPFPNGTTSNHVTTWRDLAYLDVTLSLSDTHGSKTVRRTVTERYNPRNALSGQ